jgi:hypothetical protein
MAVVRFALPAPRFHRVDTITATPRRDCVAASLFPNCRAGNGIARTFNS